MLLQRKIYLNGKIQSIIRKLCVLSNEKCNKVESASETSFKIYILVKAKEKYFYECISILYNERYLPIYYISIL